ncbi:MAG: SRPBCC family protein [Thermoplasmatota archaeon]
MTHSLEVSRFIQAPRAAVFAAFLDDQDARMRKFAPTGPDGNTMQCVILDFEPRVGGKMGYAMIPHDADPAGPFEHQVTGTFQEIIENEKIVRTEAPPGMEMATTVTVLFEDADGGTQVTIRHEGFPDSEWAEGAKFGWGSALVNLAAAWAEMPN